MITNHTTAPEIRTPQRKREGEKRKKKRYKLSDAYKRTDIFYATPFLKSTTSKPISLTSQTWPGRIASV